MCSKIKQKLWHGYVHKRQFIKAGFYGIAGVISALMMLKFFQAKVMALPIVTYPNPMLRSVAKPIEILDDSVVSLADTMISILRTRAPFDFFLKGSLCKGLSAPQIGISKRLTVCGLYGEMKILVNPEVLEKRSHYENSEYCLSLPRHQTRKVQRSNFVKVQYQDLHGVENVLTATKNSAGLLEHEIDHLNGVLYIDY
jgi:peptide deformylase